MEKDEGELIQRTLSADEAAFSTLVKNTKKVFPRSHGAKSRISISLKKLHKTLSFRHTKNSPSFLDIFFELICEDRVKEREIQNILLIRIFYTGAEKYAEIPKQNTPATTPAGVCVCFFIHTSPRKR